MIRINASYQKKVPGSQQYSSECASASIEVELADSEATTVEQKLAEMWATVRAAIEAELDRAQAMRNDFLENEAKVFDQPSNGNGNSHQSSSNGNGANGFAYKEPNAVATKKQIGYLLSCARRAKGLSPSDARAWVRSNYGVSLDDLTRQQAGQIIDQLQAQTV